MTTIVLLLGVTTAATIADIIMAGTATMVVTITEAIATAEVGRAPGGRRAPLGRTPTASP